MFPENETYRRLNNQILWKAEMWTGNYFILGIQTYMAKAEGPIRIFLLSVNFELCINSQVVLMCLVKLAWIMTDSIM
jgi:hypothetical protein